ncbi:hypothetical protein CAEBREN_32508 [Caenorhabditis brenneri]|uniref:SET domain-containing protein n=1 Tax=Caenorhabditis brenneri TaxID=135651 RepID=G0MC40_CAEBE|nr:hypothetical protein CAEBREN_32508 [Caenorhabditis brenneri]
MMRRNTPTGQEVIEILELANWDDQEVIVYDEPGVEEIRLSDDEDNEEDEDDIMVIDEVIVVDDEDSPEIVEEESPYRAVQNEHRAFPDLEILEDEDPNRAVQNENHVDSDVEILEDEDLIESVQNKHRPDTPDVEILEDEDLIEAVQNKCRPDTPDVEILEDEDPIEAVRFQNRRVTPLDGVSEDEELIEAVQIEHRPASREEEVVEDEDPIEAVQIEQRPAAPDEQILEDEEPDPDLRASPHIEMVENNEQEEQDENQAPHRENLDPLRNKADRPEKRNSPFSLDSSPIKSSPKQRRTRAILSDNQEKEDDPIESESRHFRESCSLNTSSVRKTPEVSQRKKSQKRTPQNVVVPPAGMEPTPTSVSRKRKATGFVNRERSKAKSPRDDQEEEDGTQETDPERALLKRPVIVVIDKNLKSEKLIKNRVIRVKKYKFTIPKLCTEAEQGQKHGKWERELGAWPGVPNKKLMKDQIPKYGQGQDWPVQYVYESENPTKYKVLYEGWTNDSIGDCPKDEIVRTAPDRVKEMNTRNEFYRTMREIMVAHRDRFNDEDISDMEPDNIFMLYLDLSYFHSRKNEEYGMSSIWYMHIKKESKKELLKDVLPPRFAYTPLNILNAESYEFLRRRKQNTHWDKLKDGIKLCIGPRDYKGPCKNGKGCKCDARYTLLYGEADDFNGHRFSKNIIPREDGTIDVTQFNIKDTRVIMECSDVCGCDSQCPRRQLQRGQQKPLMVFHENEDKGFGVRAAADIKSGEFICEYTGIARCAERIDFDHDEHAFLSTKNSSKNAQKKKEPEKDDTAKPYAEEEEINKLVWDTEWEKKRDDMSYEARFNLMDTSMVISANFVGNIARFINHSCDSNTAFMEVFSRRYETDVLVPRIAVYAIKDIRKGEEVTTNYYANHKVEKSSVRCRCGTKACKVYLPNGCT